MVRRWLLSTSLALVAIGVGGAGPQAMRIVDQACGAATAGDHRAVVIVDTGSQVRRVCVRFTEDSITGREALVRAGVDPVFKDYGGKGAFVCKLLDTGCPASDCPCDSSEYWVYSRARAGSSTFTMSSMGVSSTSVRDGDVEGWRWSTGGGPAYASPDAVCGAKPVRATTARPAGGGGQTTSTLRTTTAPRSTAAGGRTTTTAPATGAAASASTNAPSAAAGPAFDPGLAGAAADDAGEARTRIAARSTDSSGRGGAAAALGFGIALALVLAAWLAARSARQRRAGAS